MNDNRSCVVSRVAVSLLMALVSSDVASAQSLRSIPIKPSNGTLDAEFVHVSSVRELSDERVLLLDIRQSEIGVGDFVSQQYKRVGRKGRGPSEYEFPVGLFGVAGDSTITHDAASRRWTIFVGDKIVGVRPADDAVVRLLEAPRGMDVRGFALIQRGRPYVPGPQVITRRDSQVVLLVNRRTGLADTITRVREMPRKVEATFNENGRLVSTVPQATEPGVRPEEAFLGRNGTVWVGRQDPLRIDVRNPDGKWMRGVPILVKGEPITARERELIIEARKADRRMPQPKGPRITLPIPSTRPVLFNFNPIELPDGRIALERQSMRSVPTVRYLIVNRRGGVDGQITLKPNERLIAFGKRSVYISEKDQDDVVRLRRHPWP